MEHILKKINIFKYFQIFELPSICYILKTFYYSRKATIELNMSTNFSSNYRHFEGYYEDTNSKIFFISFSLFLHLTNLLLYYGIIWFERFGTDAKRSLLNKLVSNISWNGFVSIPLIELVDFAIYFFGPIGESLCFLFTVFRNMMKTNVLLFLDAIVLSRYIIIFWLKNPASVQDDFWSIFVAAEVVVFSFVLNISAGMLPQKHSIFYYTCADMDPGMGGPVFKTRTTIPFNICLP